MAFVALTVVSALALAVLAQLLVNPIGVKLLLVGPIVLVAYEVVIHELWWRRWWGAIPGAIVGLTTYFEGRDALEGLLGDRWAEPVAYVAAWALFAGIFTLCSRYVFPKPPTTAP